MRLINQFFVFFASFISYFVHASDPIILNLDGTYVFARHTFMLSNIVSKAKNGNKHKKKGTQTWSYTNKKGVYKFITNTDISTVSVEYDLPTHPSKDPFYLLSSCFPRTPMSDFLYDGIERPTDIVHSTYMQGDEKRCKHELSFDTENFNKIRAAVLAHKKTVYLR